MPLAFEIDLLIASLDEENRQELSVNMAIVRPTLNTNIIP